MGGGGEFMHRMLQNQTICFVDMLNSARLHSHVPYNTHLWSNLDLARAIGKLQAFTTQYCSINNVIVIVQFMCVFLIHITWSQQAMSILTA